MVHSSHICRLGNGLIGFLIIRDAKMRRRQEALQAASAIRHGQLGTIAPYKQPRVKQHYYRRSRTLPHKAMKLKW